MPIVDWLKRIMAEKTQDFLVAPLNETHGAPSRARGRLSRDGL
jgi:hypothetical protein